MLRIFPLPEGTFEVHARPTHTFKATLGLGEAPALDICTECTKNFDAHEVIIKSYSHVQLRSIAKVEFGHIKEDVYLEIAQPCRVTETATLALIEGL